MTYTIYTGNNLDILPTLPDNSVDSIVTDPPYELGFMGKKWDNSGIAYSVELWTECLRVLKPGGHLLSFGGSRTYHRMVVAIEDAGFDIRDMISWISNKTFPKSHNLKDEWQGWGTGLKPTVEPIVMARKPLIGTVAANVLEHGTGALNIDGSRIGTEERTHKWAGRSGSFTQERTDTAAGMFAGNGDGSSIVSGRWPANVILDEYSAGELDEQSGTVRSSGKFQLQGDTQATGAFPISRQMGQFGAQYADTGGASRFFYVAKASKRDRNEGLEELPDHEWRDDGAPIPQRNERPFLPSKNHHPTVKPTTLMRYLVKLVTPPNGTVLDPFTGSGSTGKAAILEGFDFIGIELTEEYLPIIEGRLAYAEQMRLNEQQKEDEGLF
jgi:DNA modification methylase